MIAKAFNLFYTSFAWLLDQVLSFIFLQFLPGWQAMEDIFKVDVSEMTLGLARMGSIASDYNNLLPFDVIFQIIFLIMVVELVLLLFRILVFLTNLILKILKLIPFI